MKRSALPLVRGVYARVRRCRTATRAQSAAKARERYADPLSVMTRCVNLVRSKPGERALEEADGIRPGRRRQHFGVRQPARIVDADMHVLPADSLHAGAPIPRDPVPDAADAPEALDIDVEELAGGRPFVAQDRGPGRQRWKPPQALAAQDAAHRGAWETEPVCDGVPG